MLRDSANGSRPKDVRRPVVEIVEPAMAAILRQKTEAERLQIAWGMWESARSMIWNLLRAEHPEWSVEELQQAVARRLAHATD